MPTSRHANTSPQYKTWIRTRPIVIFAILAATCLALSALALWNLVFLAFLIPTAIFGYILLIVGLSRLRFSAAGGDYQDRIHQLLASGVSGSSVLDVGCGSGHLLAKIARTHPAARLVGFDFWGDDWEYSQELCETNFRAEGFEGRATFVRGTASHLPPELGMFETVVSCLTFHEVRDVEDKTESLRQAVSRVAPGGSFAFIDLFDDPKFYASPDLITAAITASGGQVTEQVRLADLLALPFPLQHKRVLGYARFIAGRRTAP
jgi:SAM-dependent methyltransferase